jgi:hypothetical protein
MPAHRLTRVGSLLLIAALAGTGCSDQTGPTAPKTSETVVSRPESNPARSGATFISDLRVQSNSVYMSTGGGILNLTVVLANPGRKATGLYLQGVVRQGTLTAPTDQAPLRCTAVEGAMPRGTCGMGVQLTVPFRDFTNMLGQFTLKLLQRNPDNTVTMVDSRTVDIVIVRI